MKKGARTYPLSAIISDFIRKCRNGIRRYGEGQRISPNTIDNYRLLQKRLLEFEALSSRSIRVVSENRLTKKQFLVERRYWKKFFNSFTGFLYKIGGYDNYVGFMMKNLRAVLQFAQNEYMVRTATYRKQLYVIKEEIPIITLAPEQLQFLIQNRDFRSGLSSKMETVLDIFILGCTVALRYSDLIGIKWLNIEHIGDGYYLAVCSLKTKTTTRVRLPDYVLRILDKYKSVKRRTTIFPKHSLSWFNIQLRRLCELAGWKDECGKYRRKNGKTVELKNPRTGKSYRFCDLISSHVMRRTSITTMLMHGVPELVVRKISGHSPNSPAFQRYVNFLQGYLDQEVNRHYELMARELRE